MAHLTDLPWRTQPDGVLVRVRLTPRSSRDGVDGVETTAEGAALKVRVRAVPQSGEANTALERVLARWLDVPASKVSLTRGGKSRLKVVQIAGDPASISQTIAARVAEHATSPTRSKS